LTGRKVPSLVLAVDIARALGCTVDELIESEVG
jgi:DNA-binding XRE family transcriptional regulator